MALLLTSDVSFRKIIINSDPWLQHSKTYFIGLLCSLNEKMYTKSMTFNSIQLMAAFVYIMLLLLMEGNI